MTSFILSEMFNEIAISKYADTFLLFGQNYTELTLFKCPNIN